MGINRLKLSRGEVRLSRMFHTNLTRPAIGCVTHYLYLLLRAASPRHVLIQEIGDDDHSFIATEAIMTTTLNTRLQAKTLSPSLTVNNLQQSVAFFEGLGFGIEETWEEQGVLLGVMLRAGEARIGLSQDDWKKGRDREKGVGLRIIVETTQNIDQLAADAKKAGIALDAEPHDTPWGSRAFEVTEPSGFRVSIASLG
jgi:uncharacterized glyoxalase superfamily protein PhnB